jgi:hypothetical protein
MAYSLPLVGHFLRSGFRANIPKLRRFSAIFRRNRAWFLCNPDCLAEGSGFEPSVPFLYMPLKADESATYRDFMLETSGPEKRIVSVEGASGPVHLAGRAAKVWRSCGTKGDVDGSVRAPNG